jgi:uncharacterized protein YkwD
MKMAIRMLCVFICLFSSSVIADELDSGELEVVNKLNKARAKAGLSSLEIDLELTKDCRRWSHVLRTSKPRRVRGVFYSSTTRIWHASAKERNGHPECVAYNPDESKNAFSQWRNSPPHWSIMTKRNIKKIGVGRSGGYWTLRVKNE